jgi:hypothetical protein
MQNVKSTIHNKIDKLIIDKSYDVYEKMNQLNPLN